MKLIHTLPLVIIAACLALAGCNKQPDEKAALANFKTEVEGFTKFAEAQKPATNDPAAMGAAFNAVIAKFQSIKTDGLPADLKGAWGEMGAVLGEMGGALKGMPKIDASKPEEMMKVMGEFGAKMSAIAAKVEPIAKKLEETGKKYGLDMSKVAPGK